MRIEVTDAIKTAGQSYTQEGSTDWWGINNYVSTPPGTVSYTHLTLPTSDLV